MLDRTSTNIIARRPLLMYFVFSYAFFWLLLISFFVIAVGLLRVDVASLPAWLIPLLTIIGSWMPSLAAAIVTAVCEGRDGVRRLFARFLQFRIPAKWYLAAFIIPLGLAFAGAGIYRLLGGAPSGGGNLSLAFWAGLVGLNFFTGPTGEEPGWRGFALPRLLQKYNPLKASLLLGVVWSFWHLPLWLTSGYPPDTLLFYILFFNIGIIALTFLMTWIYRKTACSLVPMTIIHFTYNAAIQLISPQGLGLGLLLPLFGWMAGLATLAVLIIWGLGGFSDQKKLLKIAI
jgi:membrane protease YdiL (CAAX protease family)